MSSRLPLLALLTLLTPGVLPAEKLRDPSEFLGAPLGSRFTPPHRIADYAEHLAATSPRVRLIEIGRSAEDRPLQLLVVTSATNQGRLEALRQEHLRTGPDDPPTPVVVWLGFGLHGNEASSPEAALVTAWELATGPVERLEDLVVLIDPCSNPDGRARYVGGYRARRGARPDPEPLAAEHEEQWPGGRTNHWLFDLNRDWAWLTQPESRARIAELRRWEPHVVVDFHEMSSDAEYYFPPPAEPVHPGIPDEVLRWHEVFGRANAEAFDDNGWSYFVRETYDLFYPGYGDSYSSLRGAVGMTYEVSGGGRAGVARALPGNLSLAERLGRHATAARTTIATAVDEREELVLSLRRLRSTPTSSDWLLWDGTRPEAASLAELLGEHGVEVARLAKETGLRVVPLGSSARADERRFPAGSFAVDLSRPLGRLALGLLDPAVRVPADFLAAQRLRISARRDPEFYDVTAWALPLAWNLEIFRSRKTPRSLGPPEAAEVGGLDGEGDVGIVLPPSGLAGWRAVSALLEAGLPIARTLHPLELDGRRWPTGSFWIRPRATDGERIEDVLRRTGVRGHRIASGFPNEGRAPGSEDVLPVERPRIGILAGPGLRATAVGSLWHLLDADLGLRPNRLDLAALDEPELSRFDVLLFPDGSGWSEILGEERLARLERWVRDGGTAIPISRALEPWQDAGLTSIRRWEPEDGVTVPEMSGAIVATRFAPLAPLGLGLPAPPPVLVRDEPLLRATGDPRRDLLTVDSDDPVLAGVVWPAVLPGLEGALLVGVESLGRGRLVVFATDPAFRGIWRATMPLLLEAILVRPDLDLDETGADEEPSAEEGPTGAPTGDQRPS